MRLHRRTVVGVGLVALLLAGAIVWIVASGDREAELSLTRIAAVDSRVPSAMRVTVEASRRVRITFSGVQRSGSPGLNPFEALVVLQVRRRSDGGGCGTLDGDPLAAFTRWWPGVNGLGRPRAPYDLFDVAGEHLRRQDHPDLRDGSSVILHLRRPLPDHACAVAYTTVRDERPRTAGSAELPAFKTSAEL